LTGTPYYRIESERETECVCGGRGVNNPCTKNDMKNKAFRVSCQISTAEFLCATNILVAMCVPGARVTLSKCVDPKWGSKAVTLHSKIEI